MVSYLASLKVLARLAHTLAYLLKLRRSSHHYPGQVLSGLLQSPPLPIALYYPVLLINKTCPVPEAFECVIPPQHCLSYHDMKLLCEEQNWLV